MNLTNIIQILDTTLNRETISTKHDTPTVSWKNDTPYTTTINETTIPNTQKICIHNKNNNTPTVYIHTQNRTLKKYNLTDINTIQVNI